MSFFITAGSGGYKSGSSYNNTGGMLNQMVGAPSPNQQNQKQKKKAKSSSMINKASKEAAPQPSFRTFRVDPYDYKPQRIGIRYAYKAIVIDYGL